MEGVDENTSVDEFTFDLLRRAKERSQVFSEKLKHSEEEAPNIEKIMEKLEKRSSVASSSGSPEKVPVLCSPAKTTKRPILKPVTSNNEEYSNLAESRSARKTVTTFDAVTGDTIIEAKTFTSDNEYSDEDVDMDETEQEATVNERDEKLDEVQDEEGSEGETPIVETTPQLSKTLKKLAAFHSEELVESPVHPHTPLESFVGEAGTESEDVPSEMRVSASRTARTSRLSALARTINEWEDDLTHHNLPGSRFMEAPITTSRASLAGKSRFSAASSPASSPLSFGVKQTNGVRLFNNDDSFSSPMPYQNSRLMGNSSNQKPNCKIGEALAGGGNNSVINSSSNSNEVVRLECDKIGLGFQQTVLTKMHKALEADAKKNAVLDIDSSKISECWDEALMKSLELQGFSKKPSSPLKQIREKSPGPEVINQKYADDRDIRASSSPKKTYFGGSPSRSSPTKAAPPPPPLPQQVQSPMKSPTKNTNLSPAKQNFAVGSPSQAQKNVQSVRSFSPVKSPVKQGYLPSPVKSFGKASNAESPVNKPVSAIRMKFEQNVAPPKPGRAHLKPTVGRVSPSKSPLKNRFNDSRSNTPDPSTLSVAERKRLFENSNFSLAPPKMPAVVEVQSKKPVVSILTSSPTTDCVKPPLDINISAVPIIPSTDDNTNVKRPAPAPPIPEQVTSSPIKRPAPQPPAYVPPPPPPPSMPSTSTPTSVNSKRRSSSPVRSLTSEAQSVKRIKVNAPKPGHMYPSLTDIETETETEHEGHCSDDDSMDDSLESQQSLGAQIETIAKACSPIRPAPGSRLPARYRPSEDFSATFACATVDALIDEALEGQDVTMGTIDGSTILEVTKTSTPHDKRTHSSDTTPSFEPTVLNVDVSSSRSPSPVVQDGVLEEQEASYSEADTTASSSFTSSPVVKPTICSAIVENTVNRESLPVQSVDQGPTSPISELTTTTQWNEQASTRPLVHTVSFYRKQQQQQKKAEFGGALHEISEHPEISDDSEEEIPPAKINIGEEIKKLEDEVERCNLSIAQASKALTWCKALVGFSDSTENIEGERILLIETQKRLALLNSIHRLKTEGALGHQVPSQMFSPSKQEVSPSCKGDMKISDIAITLRKDFFTSYRAECQYHFICLIENKHQIEHSSLLTHEGQRQGSILKFSNEFSLRNLTPDFRICLEVYYLESAKEYLPHEAKYRINAKKDAKHATLLLSPLLTPSKKSGKGDHTKSQVHSPAGPDAVKSSSFKFCGGLSIDISSLQRTYWELDKASGPLTGGISIKVQCSAMGGVEHRGFLTLFEDVSGYGAWIRRWCRLGPAVLEFWKYPEDETECKKPPLGTLNLHECVTSKVRPAPRDVCARANTLLLVTTRAPHPNDKNTLVTSCHKSYTAVRHLISADTREERDIWCQRLNKALANLRAWDPVAKQSVDDNVF